MIGWFGRKQDRLAPVRTLFGRIAESSRAPMLYRSGLVPDTFEGRFESLALHMFVVMRRLRELPPPAADLSQDLVDACFAYLELGFRNGGISDIAVPKRMKKIARSFYGRVQAYDTALDAGEGEFAVAIERNVAVGSEQAAELARYVLRDRAALAGATLPDILARDPLFSEPEAS